MLLVKTQAGQDALKDRHAGLTPRQRTAFILFDGHRTLNDVLAATGGMGITEQDVQAMIAQGLLAPAAKMAAMPSAASAPPSSAVAAHNGAPSVESSQSAPEPSGRSPMERYQAAYPIATQLTAALGLRGFRLNLAVEGAGSFDDLAALAPKIRQAVGDANFSRLERALFS